MTKVNEGLEAKKLAEATVDLVKNTKKSIEKVVRVNENGLQINVVEALNMAMKLPGATIDRENFLKNELKRITNNNTLELAISNNPAYAGISTAKINKIADSLIKYERNKVSAISFFSGLPGGFAMVVAIGCDLVQYFYHVIRIAQELAYLYGYNQFEFNEEKIDHETMNRLLIFVGVMYGVNSATQGIKTLSKVVQGHLTKTIAKTALTKTAYYPVIKKILSQLGIKITKQVFAKSVGKVVPIIGGFVSGGITFISFGTSCNKLKKNFASCDLAKPSAYKKKKKNKDVKN